MLPRSTINQHGKALDQYKVCYRFEVLFKVKKSRSFIVESPTTVSTNKSRSLWKGEWHSGRSIEIWSPLRNSIKISRCLFKVRLLPAAAGEVWWKMLASRRGIFWSNVREDTLWMYAQYSDWHCVTTTSIMATTNLVSWKFVFLIRSLLYVFVYLSSLYMLLKRRLFRLTVFTIHTLGDKPVKSAILFLILRTGIG